MASHRISMHLQKVDLGCQYAYSSPSKLGESIQSADIAALLFQSVIWFQRC